MPGFHLLPHADRAADRAQAITVDMTRSGDLLTLTYLMVGDGVRWPDRQLPVRADELWRTTCFELFLRFDDHERYVEFNFSPSTRWAAYAFEGYREGMTDLPLAVPPRIERLPDGVQVALDLAGLPHGEPAMALTAVIEEESGTRSFWSLAHPPGAPDFHHPACFAARLPPPEAA